MIKIKNIITGWGKTLGLLEVSEEEKLISLKRLEACSTCPAAKPSKVLEFIKGEAEEIDTLACTKCGCPIHEKSIVKDETCPMDKWEI